MEFYLKSILLGIIQGITEFIPVSSSGHLVLAQHFLAFESPDIIFEILVHFGTLLSVIIYFRKDITRLIFSLAPVSEITETRRADHKTLLYLLVGTIVTGILGFLFQAEIRQLFARPLFAASMLLVTGTVVFLSDYIPPRHLNIHQTGIFRSIIIGVSQAFAIIPGISRSGMTITAGMTTGLKRDAAARFSFLLAIPAILGATIFDIRSLNSIERAFVPGYILGMLAAFISGYLVIALLMKLISKRRLKIFGIYCWVVGLSVIFLLIRG